MVTHWLYIIIAENEAQCIMYCYVKLPSYIARPHPAVYVQSTFSSPRHLRSTRVQREWSSSLQPTMLRSPPCSPWLKFLLPPRSSGRRVRTCRLQSLLRRRPTLPHLLQAVWWHPVSNPRGPVVTILGAPSPQPWDFTAGEDGPFLGLGGSWFVWDLIILLIKK